MSKRRAPRRSYRSPSGRYWNWPAIYKEARRKPGIWWLVEGSVSPAAVRAVNQNRIAPYTGLRAEGRNLHTVNGRPAVDFFIRYNPEEP